MTMRLGVMVALLAAGLASAAAPAKLGYQGRLFKASGVPETGTVKLDFTLFDSATSASAIWTESHATVGLNDGFYSVYLGDLTTIGPTVFDGRELYLELAVNGTPVQPRQRVASVPYAMTCSTALGVAGGTTVNAGSVQVNGTTVIDAAGHVSVSALPAHAHSAADITSGVLDPARLPAMSDASKLPLAGGTMTGAINMGGKGLTNTAAPVAAGDAVNKAYVDALGSGTATAGGACYYTSATLCISGYVQAPGVYLQPGPTNNNICCPQASGGAPTAAFVITNGTFSGNLGGMAGADAKCLTDLQASPWLGKSNFTLNSTTVHAFLCDAATCNNLKSNTTYQFAQSGSIDIGGATFTTDAYGRGPNNNDLWSDPSHLGSGTYWTGRNTLDVARWSLGPSGSSCAGWTSQSSSATGGDPSSQIGARWGTPLSCILSLHLICFVNQ